MLLSRHRGTLATESGRALAVLPSGHHHVPGGQARLLAALGERGAAVSVYPPDTRLTRYRLLANDQLLAALTTAIVVVETGRRGRALVAATAAAAAGRPVLAVPGPATSALSAGCHQLLCDGAAAVATGVEDVAHTLQDAAVAPAAR